MKKFVFLFFVVTLVVMACRKPVDKEVKIPYQDEIGIVDTTAVENTMPPCDCFNDNDQSMNFNGVWNMVYLELGFGGHHPFDKGYNVWFFDEQDSSVVICNATDKGPDSGDYSFVIDQDDQFFLLDSLDNNVIIYCCSSGKNYQFNENGFYFYIEGSQDGPDLFFERND